ncbi:MAG: hypothetical protein ACOH1P_07785 [Lysobacter sp.]
MPDEDAGRPGPPRVRSPPGEAFVTGGARLGVMASSGFVYTPDAAQYGGNMQARLNQCIAQSTQAYRASDLDIEWRVAHAVQGNNSTYTYAGNGHIRPGGQVQLVAFARRGPRLGNQHQIDDVVLVPLP